MKQKILITGASRGLGRAFVEVLANKGHTVYATMRSPDKNDPYQTKGDVKTLELDVTNPEQVKEVIEPLDLDVIINNAGYGLYCPIELATEEEMFEQFNVNLFGACRVIQAALPKMRAKKSGKIINISSIVGVVSHPYLGHYAATKHALEAISFSLQATTHPWNIKVVVVEPGRTGTDFAHSLQIGERCVSGNPYEPSCSDYLNKMVPSIDAGQDPMEVALLVSEIIDTKEPHFRYQTTERLKSVVANYVVDPTGDQWVKENIIA
jgi:short-subunit dehydrogenase